MSLSASRTAVSAEGIVTLTASASDNVGVVSVRFLDGTTTIATVNATPYVFDVSLTSSDNGDHGYSATARDAAGNQGTSAVTTVAVAIPNLPSQDDFNDNRLDSTQWVASANGGPSVQETGGRLELTIPATITDAIPAAQVTLRCSVTGDIDAQVDYEVLDWPAQSGVRVAIGSDGGAAERVSFAAGDFTEVESYVSDHVRSAGTITSEATADTSGKLRLTRTGGTFTSYYWDGAAWKAMQSTIVGPDEAMLLRLSAWTHSQFFIGQTTRVAFDNFVVNAGHLGSCS